MKQNKTLQNTYMVLTSQIISMILNLVLQVVISRLLLPEGRGVYAICMMFSSMMLIFTFLGNEFGIRYLLVQSRINIQQSFKYLCLTSFFAFVLSVIILIPLSDLEFGFLGKATSSELYLSLAFGSTLLITTQLNVFLTITNRFKNAAIIVVGSELIKLIAITSSLLIESSVALALLANIIVNIAIVMYYIFKFDLVRFSGDKLSVKDIKFIYSYGLKSFFLTLNNFSNIHIATLVLSFYVASEKIGIFSIALALVSKVQVIPDAINRVLVPFVTSQDNAIIKRNIVLTAMAFMIVLSVLIMSFLLVFGDSLIILLFGPSYKEASLLMKILFIGISFKILIKPIEAYFSEIMGEPLQVSKFHAVTMIIMLVLLNLLIPPYELIGASAASSFTMIVSFSMIFYLFFKTFDKSETLLSHRQAIFQTLNQILNKVVKK